ncbi:hypothetical protein GQ43DRAFT_471574 [Delitschia confertaspora ATCC 74209]|uniref:Uncharacterized protein n=1 Tax=Delitschia confertaspora ATCC 74209 TaxID=1513339 RepID=A0A9P4JLG5_9PLEO|nr:hypothetical protein GQ43DRAFT_471574 [Delitschia confertaspora ATCC 74209]
MATSHTRAGSNDSATSTYQAVLEHLFQYPGSYDIPLRTMYTLNTVARAQPLPKQLSRAPSPTSSPVSDKFAWSEANAASANFTSALMNQISSLPSQPTSLPASFITSFVSRCMHPDLNQVDFTQGLAALDYLKDLETQRRKHYAEALDRMTVQSEETDVDRASNQYSQGWATVMEAKNKKALLNYTMLYIGVRRWIMINELEAPPFNKLNCMGMLNTLYPPQPPETESVQLPTPMITAEQLQKERDGYFMYIRKVEKHGKVVLQNVRMQGKAPHDATGWPAVQRAVDNYLRVANNMIECCVTGTITDKFLTDEETVQTPEKRNRKKIDSGVSFGSDRRPSTAYSGKDKPLPASPVEPKTPTKVGNTFQKWMRDMKKIKIKTRPDVEEMVKLDRQPTADDMPSSGETNMKKSLKKARSMAALTSTKSANASSTSLFVNRKASDAEFNVEAMKQHRMMYEALSTKKSSKRVV